jgi:ATP-dependent DNA helicase RecG
MAITPEQIDAWRGATDETATLEFKEAKQQYDVERLFEYCVAIANEGGGFFVLGVTNVPPRPVVGTFAFQNPNKIAERIFDALHFRVDVEEVQHPSGRVVVFTIPSRPVGTPYHRDGKYLMRCGESLQPMSADRLRTIFDEGKPDWIEQPAKSDLTDDDIFDLLDVAGYFKLMKYTHFQDQFAAISRLLDDRIIDRVSADRYMLRRIGALLLAYKLSEFQELQRKAPRVIVYTGKSKFDTKLTQVGAFGYAVGFQGLISFIMNQIPQNEVIEDALRKETKLVPDMAIRELVANAIIHQDFSQTGASIAIEIYSNRIDISNPGQPIVPLDRFIDGYKSRNERLADFLRRMGICEEKGSGIDKVVGIAEIYQLPAPNFAFDDVRTLVTIFGPKKVEDMDRADRVRACYQHCALKFVMDERMTNQSLRARFHLPESKSAIVSQAISATVEDRLVKLDEKVGNSRRFARYVPFWA